MIHKRILSLLLVLSFFQSMFSQEVHLKIKAGEFMLKQQFDCNTLDQDNYRLIFFNQIPNDSDKKELNMLGVDFLEYLPKNIFVAALDAPLPIEILQRYEIYSVNRVLPEYKLDPKIQDGRFPDWAIKNDYLFVKIIFYKDIIMSHKIEMLRIMSRIEDINEFSNCVTISLNPENLYLIAELESVFFIEPIDPPSKPENKTGRSLHRSNAINTDEYTIGRHYDGTGINIMMQDDGIIGPHIDYHGRIDQSNCGGCSTSSSSDHGDHVAGTIMGSGNLDPEAAGMANGAFLYVYSSSNNNYYDVPTIYQNNDVIITSKSYSNGCNAGYTSLAQDLDEQINLYPSLIHIFSAGNDGNSDCGYGAGSGWGNVTGGHKQAKNVIAVANLNSVGNLSSSSSRGPAADGRIKPDIGAKGTSVNSTIPDNNYGLKTGTSMACPGIAGVMSQLYHAYKELNSGQNPSSALMKCVILNSADDIGNVGPDFKHGWGEVNALRAVKILENNQYFSDVVSQSAINSHQIMIPTGVEQLKIMVYWHDKEASTSSSIALVNDINVNLNFPPLGLSYDPWVLDETPNSSSLNALAVRGVDDLNNVEQITLNNPIQGTYILDVSGFSIPFGPQSYWVTYEFITTDVELTYPIGGEGLVPGEIETIRWDASESTLPFVLEYTTDGISWATISSSVSQNVRYYNWTVPNIPSELVKVRITRSNSVDESENLTIVDVPQNIIVDWICPDSIYVYWDPVNGATSYEVSMLGNMYMDSITTSTTTNSFFINPNSSIVDSWFSVCAKVNGGKGRRAVAINEQPTNSGCIAPPIAGFTSNSVNSCSGEISFTDISFNVPNNWYWDFGDGYTSTQQNPVHTYLLEGIYSVKLIVSNNLGIDSIILLDYINIDFPPGPIVDNDTICDDSASFILSSLSSNVKWYQDTLGSLSLFSGTPFITPVISNTTNYYVREFGGPSIFGGPTDNTIGNGAYYYGNRHMILDCYSACKLISATVYAEISNTITFELRDSNGIVLDDTVLSVIPGQQTLYFDFDIPIGNNLQLGINGSNSGLYRNNTGASFPNDIGSLVSFTGANISSAPDNWYFFYNIQLRESCKSEFSEVTAVLTSPIVPPVVNQAGNILSVPNNPGYNYQWYLNGNMITGADSSSYVFSIPGNYYIEISYMGCIEQSNSILTSFDNDIHKISIYPNPATSIVNIELDNIIEKIYLFDISSRLLIDDYIDLHSYKLDVSSLASGVYFLDIKTKHSIIRRELVVNNENK